MSRHAAVETREERPGRAPRRERPVLRIQRIVPVPADWPVAPVHPVTVDREPPGYAEWKRRHPAPVRPV
jgi:hypothetical protein